MSRIIEGIRIRQTVKIMKLNSCKDRKKKDCANICLSIAFGNLCSNPCGNEIRLMVSTTSWKLLEKETRVNTQMGTQQMVLQVSQSGFWILME